MTETATVCSRSRPAVAVSQTMSNLNSFADKPTLVGEKVTLRPVAAVDAVHLGNDDPEGRRLTGSHRTFTAAQLEHWYATRADFDDRLDLAVIDRATGIYVGEVVLNDLVPENESCNFRILLVGAQNRGRGLGTEATRLILAHAFETVGLHRVELEVYAFNPGARRVYEKVGFVYEGTKREALRWDGEWLDADTMSILADEWARHRGRASHWLQNAELVSGGSVVTCPAPAVFASRLAGKPDFAEPGNPPHLSIEIGVRKSRCMRFFPRFDSSS
jgi:RimJ/RimL family protein N-acetyltransferase